MSAPRKSTRPENSSPGRRAITRSLLAELDLARREIREGRFQRSMALMAAFAAIVSGFEAYMQHVRGAFRDWLMWTPVALAVPTVMSSIAALFRERLARTILPLVSVVSLVDGIVGFVFHLRGIKRMPGGFRVGQYNIVMGPPVFAPLLMCMVGIMGILSGLLRREAVNLPRPEAVAVTNAMKSIAAAAAREATTEHISSRIAHGRFQKGMALTSVFFAVLAGGEAYFEHLRGSFNQRVMWTPVWVTVPMVVTGVAATLSKTVARALLPFSSAATFATGVLGFFLHLRGVKRMPGGFRNFRFNITLGPPLFAPLLFTAVGLLGFVATLLRRERGR